MVSNGTRAYKSQQSEWTIPWWQARPISGWANVRDVKGRYLSIRISFRISRRHVRKPTISSKTGKTHCQCDSFYTCLHNEISCFFWANGKADVFFEFFLHKNGWLHFCTNAGERNWPHRVRQKFQTCFPPWRFISPYKSCIKFSNHTKSKLLLKIRSSSQTCQTLESVQTNKKSVESWWRLMTQLQMRPLFELFGLSLFLT